MKIEEAMDLIALWERSQLAKEDRQAVGVWQRKKKWVPEEERFEWLDKEDPRYKEALWRIKEWWNRWQ